MIVIVRKNQFISLVFLFVVAVLSITIIATNSQKKLYRSRAEDIITPAPEASPSAHIALLETVIESKNIETDNLINKYEQTTDEGEQQNIVSSLENNLTERKNNLLSLLKLSPLSVYKKTFDKDKIEKLQKVGKIKDKKLTEEHIDEITGTVNTTIYDDFDNNTSYTRATFIPDDIQDEEVNFYPTDHQTFPSGTKVTLKDAVRMDEKAKVLGVSSVYAQDQEQQSQPQKEEESTPQSHLVAVEIQTIETPLLDTLGEQKILVLLVKPEDVDESQLPTSQEIEDRINGPIKQFYEKNSYGKMTLSVKVIKKWYEIESSLMTAIMKKRNLNILNNIVASKIIRQAFENEPRLITNYTNERFAIVIAAKEYGGISSLGRGKVLKLNVNKIEQTISTSILISTLVTDTTNGFYINKNVAWRDS